MSKVECQERYPTKKIRCGKRYSFMENGKNKMKTGICLFCCCLAVVLFSGCGESAPEDTSDQVYYHIQETSIPDPNDDLRGVFENEYRISQLDLTLQGDSFYRIVQCFTLDGSVMAKNYVQILEPPYQEWITEEVEWGSLQFYYILSAEGRKLNLLSYSSGGYLLANWQQGQYQLYPIQDSFQEDFPEYAEYDSVYMTSDGGLCIYQRSYQESGGTVTVFDDKLQAQETMALGGITTICGLLQEPESGELLWYGTKDYRSGIWRLKDGTNILPDAEAMGSMSTWYLRAAYTKEGELYLADNQSLWRIVGDETKEVCHFSDRNYQLEELNEMEVQEDGSLLLYVKCDGEKLLLRIEGNNEPFPEKQEITFATLNWEQSSLTTDIDRFNRSNELYHVTAIVPEISREEFLSGEAVNITAEFTRQIQMEMAVGRGPDLILGSSHLYFGELNLGDLARNGMLQSVEGMLEDEDAYWPAALESGRINGKLYGVPYNCHIFLTTYSESFTASRQSWTIEELMEAVRETDADMLQCGLDGTAIVLAYGLYDNDSKAYIDWENRVSHLTEEPFLELLEFAKEYADDGQDGRTDEGKAVQEGRTIAANPHVFGGLNNYYYLTEMEDIFQGEPAHLGFPRSEGNGIYVIPDMFFVNAQTDKKEGIEVLFQFLLSEENQKRDVSRPFDNQRFILFLTSLPVRLDALERSIELAVQKGQSPSDSYWSYGISKEQEIWARFLIENARPGNFYVKEIESIIDEELEPYFQGQRTAEEAARILDNRVQLYLDEQG